MAPEQLAARYVEAVELHAVDSLRELLSAGLDVRQPVQGKPAAQWLLEMYTRSDRFVEFLRVLLQHGAELGDPLLAPVLLDDVVAIEAVLSVTPAYATHRTSLPCTFTPRCATCRCCIWRPNSGIWRRRGHCWPQAPIRTLAPVSMRSGWVATARCSTP